MAEITENRTSYCPSPSSGAVVGPNRPASIPPGVPLDTCNLMQANHSYAPCYEEEAKRSTCAPLKLSVLEQQLLDAGVTPALLWERWGVTLWSIRPKSGRVKIKVDAQVLLNINELEHWFEKILRQPVTLNHRSISQCCQSPCKGCLWAEPDKREFWGQPAASCHTPPMPPRQP